MKEEGEMMRNTKRKGEGKGGGVRRCLHVLGDLFHDLLRNLRLLRLLGDHALAIARAQKAVLETEHSEATNSFKVF